MPQKREESLSAISPPMGPRPWGSLPLPFCWKSAIISGITIRRCMTDVGRIVPTGVSGITLVSLDQLFEKADVIALHCPLFPETEGIICRDNIAKMKDGVIIINNSRGPLIVEQDLYDALESGKVFAAGLDVVSSEPIREDNILLKAKNCIITPHISWASRESRSRLMDIAAANLGAFIDGNAVNVVNL